MPRFFVSREEIADGRVTVSGSDAWHISRALRMAAGEKVTVCDPDGKEYLCELDSFSDKSVGGRILSVRMSDREPPSRLIVYQAFPKGEKADLIVQKAVESGAAEICFFPSSRCIARPEGASLERKIERWQRIACEAAKQCGRSLLPTVSCCDNFETALRGACEASLPLLCYEGEGTFSLKCLLPREAPASIALMIGPEGGFSRDEAAAASACGMKMTGLGKRILRTETASGFALACLSFAYELESPGMSPGKNQYVNTEPPEKGQEIDDESDK